MQAYISASATQNEMVKISRKQHLESSLSTLSVSNLIRFNSSVGARRTEGACAQTPFPLLFFFFFLFSRLTYSLGLTVMSLVAEAGLWQHFQTGVYHQHVARCNCPLTVESIHPGVGDAVSHCAVVPVPPTAGRSAATPHKWKKCDGGATTNKHELLKQHFPRGGKADR